jgi:aerobic-type carbon monoxide dehydrogenase small subunit (CoxS/CutS family)
MPRYVLKVNGGERPVEAAAETPLLWVLRDSLGLTGTKFGCGRGFCGACSVHLEGRVARSCMVAVADVGRRAVVTIEGLSPDGGHPVQRAWLAEDVPQCGYCQAGQIMAAADLLARKPKPTDAEIEAALAMNLCRCGTYVRIRRAVRRAAQEVRS